MRRKEKITLLGAKLIEAQDKLAIKLKNQQIEADEKTLAAAPTKTSAVAPAKMIAAPTPAIVVAKNNEYVDTAAIQKFRSDCRMIMRRRYDESILPGATIRVALGIDFGTSCSKVVWRSNRSNVSRPICFGENKNALESYTVPSLVALKKNNRNGKSCEELVAGFSAEADGTGCQIRNFKICLACEKDHGKECGINSCRLTTWRPNVFAVRTLKSAHIEKNETEFVTAFFLARLIRKSKLNVLSELTAQGVPPNTRIKWSAALAVPDKFIEQSQIAETFEKTLQTAWLMTKLFEEKSVSKYQDVFQCFVAAKELGEEMRLVGKAFDCFIFPEVAAEVAAITMSPTSEEGLYALVDVGAGTVDASVFRFSRLGDKSQFTYAAGVFKHGATHIESIAHKRCPDLSLPELKLVKEQFLDQKPEDSTLTSAVAAIKDACNQIRQRSEKDLETVFRAAYAKEANVNVWRNELKLVLGGGGSAIKAYCAAAKTAFTPKGFDHELPTIKLSKPADFEMNPLSKQHFHRFAVAYGLAHNNYLPEVFGSTEVEPLSNRKRREIIDQTNDG